LPTKTLNLPLISSSRVAEQDSAPVHHGRGLGPGAPGRARATYAPLDSSGESDRLAKAQESGELLLVSSSAGAGRIVSGAVREVNPHLWSPGRARQRRPDLRHH